MFDIGGGPSRFGTRREPAREGTQTRRRTSGEPVQSASDDLTKPLGAPGERRPPSRAVRLVVGVFGRVPFARILGAAAILAATALVAWLAIGDDPFGGEPHAVVEIRDGAPPQGAVADASPPQSGLALIQDMTERPRTSAAEVESRSGVSVMRPDGAADSGALIIEVPQDGSADPRPGSSAFTSGGLAPAPDPRLVERTRSGLLPRIGDDGALPWRVYARPPPPMVTGDVARVAILVTGMGISQVATVQAIDRLPEDVSFAFAPYGGDLDRHVASARAEGHEVFLQAPMEPFDYPASDPGPHTLTTSAQGTENADRLAWVMGRISGYVGIVNFMGARMSASAGAFRPVLEEIGGRGLAYVDDGSSPRTLAPGIAAEIGMPVAVADIVLDPVPDPARIDEALARLEARARERGFALATASALPMTVERIAAWAAQAQARGIRLVPVSSTLSVPPGG